MTWPSKRYDLEVLLRQTGWVHGSKWSDLKDNLCLAGQPNVAGFADHYGYDRAQIWRWMKHGVTWHAADRLAVACGLHPAAVWPEWLNDSIVWADDPYTDALIAGATYARMHRQRQRRAAAKAAV